MIYNISVPLIRHGPSRRPVLCVARVPWVATVRRWLRRRGCETCELTELREEWPVTVELVGRLAEVQSPLVLHGRVQSRKIVWWVPFYPPSWSMTKIIVLFLDIWLTPPWHLAHTPLLHVENWNPVPPPSAEISFFKLVSIKLFMKSIPPPSKIKIVCIKLLLTFISPLR